MKDIILAKKIAQAVSTLGGQVYYVGGCVRDGLMGKESTDLDIEVHGITREQLEKILDDCGKRKEVGKSFGIYMLEHHSLDIALPRKERPTGNRHQDFAVEVNPFIDTLTAAKRRDFTVNAMMQDVLSGEVIDHFDGKADLEKKILRHVDETTFPEDPLRVLRGAQFAARFDFALHADTITLCKNISLKDLSRQRVMEELKKALLTAHKPSRFFNVLRECEQLDIWFGELSALIGVKQNPKYHAEGDVWNHTMMVLDKAAELRDQANEPLFFMLSALFHDLGKAVSTKLIDGILHSYGHDNEGVAIAATALKRLTDEHALTRYVLNMVKLHMRPHALAAQNASKKATNRLFDSAVCPEDLLLLSKADDLGRLSNTARDHMPFLLQRLGHYQDIIAKPQVRGQDLTDAGLIPDEHFKDLLAYAHKLHLSGVDKETALKQTLSYYKTL